MSRKQRRQRRLPPARKPRQFSDAPQRSPGAPARSGQDYRSEKYIRALNAAETGIYESFIISERELTDAEVRRDLESLAQDIRENGYQPAGNSDEGRTEEEPKSLVVESIRRRWEDLFERQSRHSDEELAGLLRVPLDSLEIWATPEPNSRGYLFYLEGFLTHMGIKIQTITPEGDPEPEEETEETRLMGLGRNWILQSNEAAGRAFRQRIQELLAAKQPGPVIHACQYLIGYTGEEPVVQQLSPFLTPAYRQLGVPFGMKRRR